MSGKLFELTDHAAAVIAARGIELEWVALALSEPYKVELHRSDPSLRYAFVVVEENEGRVLRVVYNGMDTPPRVVTAYFDRTRRGKR